MGSFRPSAEFAVMRLQESTDEFREPHNIRLPGSNGEEPNLSSEIGIRRVVKIGSLGN